MIPVKSNTPTYIFAALLPLIFGFLVFILKGNTTAGEYHSADRSHWTLHLDEAVFQSDSLEILTDALYNESLGEGRPEILATLLLHITQALNHNGDETPQVLTDLLRDLSLEHEDAMVRYSAYEAMLASLETEYRPYPATFELVTN